MAAKCSGASRERVLEVVVPKPDLLRDPAFVDEGVALQGTVQPVGVDEEVVAEVLGQPAREARGEVILPVVPPPVPVAVADEAVRYDEEVLVHGRSPCRPHRSMASRRSGFGLNTNEPTDGA